MERYLRLLIYDGIGTDGSNPFGNPYWYDSHMGINGLDKIVTDGLLDLSSIDSTQYTPIPMDFSKIVFPKGYPSDFAGVPLRKYDIWEIHSIWSGNSDSKWM